MEKIHFRRAKLDDLPTIVEMLADDILGAKREQFTLPLPSSYTKAFRTIDADPNQELMTVLSENQIIGTFQLTLIQYLNYQGSSRMMIESVRISRAYRGKGIGELVMKWTIDHAKKKTRQCCSSYLTNNALMPSGFMKSLALWLVTKDSNYTLPKKNEALFNHIGYTLAGFL